MDKLNKAEREETQEAEFALLCSIYETNLEDLRKNDAWKVQRPPEFSVQLTPGKNIKLMKETKCSVSLWVKFHDDYPNSSPELKLESFKGLTRVNIQEMNRKIKGLCLKNIGGMMIFEICNSIEGLLTEYEDAPMIATSGEYEKMKNDEIAEKKRLKKQREEKKLQDLLQHRINKDKRLAKADRNRCSPGSESEEEDHTEGVSQIKFVGGSNRQKNYLINKGELLGESSRGSIVYAGMDALSGILVAIHQWEILCPDRRKSFMTAEERIKFDRCRSAINVVIEVIEALKKLKHQNLVHYLAMKEDVKSDHLQFAVLMEFIQGCTLESKLVSKEKLPVDTIRSYTEQMLSALHFLHRNGHVHRNFTASSVIVRRDNVLKICDYEIGERLFNLRTESLSGFPQKTPKVSSNDSSIKSDIRGLGLIVLSLVQGQMVNEVPSNLSSLQISRELKDFLHLCFVFEDKKKGANDLLDHDFITAAVTYSGEVDTAAAGDTHTLKPNSTTTYENQSLPLQSRVSKDFEQLEMLGKGAFGNVQKVRNRLDGNFYALKKIHLEDRVNFFNRRISREVQLLSDLNHENVVRYYNSWIETLKFEAVDSDDNDSSKSGEIQVQIVDVSHRNNFVNDLKKEDEDEFSWNKSYTNEDDEDEDDEDDDESSVMSSDDDDNYQHLVLANSVSDDDSIVFVASPEDQSKLFEICNQKSLRTWKRNQMKVQRFLYIQMEYCENSTLRSSIDEGLLKDHMRMWRLLREILEGLTYIHKKQIIHRDLKPQNIFLDRDDHVKIGDFGLAANCRLNQQMMEKEEKKKDDVKSDEMNTASTGLIGTALYVAPELDGVSSKQDKKPKKMYGSRADIYSLGIIFFEMSYHQMKTRMERCNVLHELRQLHPRFPRDIDMETAEAKIVKWCLNHDPQNRPFADELLKSSLVPAPQLERSYVLKGLHEILQTPQTKAYKLVVDEMFNQKDDLHVSAVYDLDIQRKFRFDDYIEKQKMFESLNSTLRLFGAVRVDTPILLPRYDLLGGSAIERDSYASVVDSGGAVVTLPYNLRVPFARFVKSKNITSMRRYSIAKVYRARQVKRSHPKESWRCCFDIVTPVPRLEATAEVMSLTAEVVASNQFVFHVNHLRLLLHLLNSCGCHGDDVTVVLTTLSTLVDELTKDVLISRLSGKVAMSKRQISSLYDVISTRGSIQELRNAIRLHPEKISDEVQVIIVELEKLQSNVRALKISLPLFFNLAYVCRQFHHYDDVIFRVTRSDVRNEVKEVVAAGGRYDKLLADLHHLQLTNPHLQSHHVVGVSIDIDRLVMIGGGGGWKQDVRVEVLVCSVGKSLMIRERLSVVKALRDEGIAAEMEYDVTSQTTLGEIIIRATSRMVPCVVILNHKHADEAVLKFQHSNFELSIKSALCNIVSEVKRGMKKKDEQQQHNHHHQDAGKANQSSLSNFGGSINQLMVEVMTKEKQTSHKKKQIEMVTRKKLSSLPLFSCLSSKIKTHAILTDLSICEIYKLTSNMKLQTVASSPVAPGASDIYSGFECQSCKYRSYLRKVADRIVELKVHERIQMVLLYSLEQNQYHLLA